MGVPPSRALPAIRPGRSGTSFEVGSGESSRRAGSRSGRRFGDRTLIDDVRTIGQLSIGIAVVVLLVGWGIFPAWCQSVAMISVTCACAAAIVVAATDTHGRVASRSTSWGMWGSRRRAADASLPQNRSRRSDQRPGFFGIGPVMLSMAVVLGCIALSTVSWPRLGSSIQIMDPTLASTEIQSILRSKTPPSRLPSIMPTATRAAWMPWVIVWAAAAASGSLFRRREDRVLLMQGLCVVGWCFAFWGIAQRCRGSSELLFGYEAPSRAVPFSTVIYKNAAAAWLSIALSANVGWMLHRGRSAWRATNEKLRERQRQAKRRTSAMSVRSSGTLPYANESSRVEKSSRDGGLPGVMVDPLGVALMCGCGLLATAILFTLCRAMYVLLPLTLVIAGWTLRPYLGKRSLVTLSMAMVATVAIGCGGLQSTAIRARVQSMVGNGGAASMLQTFGQGRVGHWMDAAETITHAPWFGSGLGTYGYATLEHLDQVAPRWFEHAHNMPLEIAVELGLLGLGVVVVWTWIAVRRCRWLGRELTHSSDNLVRHTVVVISLLPLLVQNLFDFTILHPAVAASAAVWMAAMMQRPSGVSSSDASRSPQPIVVGGDGPKNVVQPARQPPGRFGRFAITIPAWLAMGTVAVICIVGNLEARQLLARSRVLSAASSLLANQPSVPELQSLESRLQECLGRFSDDAAIRYQLARIAQWRFRYALMSDARREGIEMDARRTHPQSVWASIDALSDHERWSIRQEWFAADATAIGTEYVMRVAESVRAQPRSAPTWLMLADAYAMAGYPTQALIDRAARLDRAGGRNAFRIAVHARRLNDADQFCRAGVRVLRFAPEMAGPLLGILDDWIDADRVAREWLAVLPPERMVAMVRTIHREPGRGKLASSFQQQAWRLLSDPASEYSLRARAIASWRLASATGVAAPAIPILDQAIQTFPEDATLRSALASALERDDRHDEAMRQWRIVLHLQPNHPTATERIGQ